MKYRFILKDVKVEQAPMRREVSGHLFSDGFYTLNQNEFSMDVKGVASFYVSGGNFISIVPYPEADKTTIELYLNGSAYGAILYQRKILPMHGSCFRYQGKGVMICGDAGVGKSSLTASFCLNGADFLTDDVTPLLVKEGHPYIWALSDRIKLWGDTLKQLKQKEDGLHRIEPETDKYYYHMGGAFGDTFRLDQVYILESKKTEAIVFEELYGSSKFTALRGEIYRPDYLRGMPDNEAVYFRNLVDISNKLKVVRVQRPEDIRVQELMEAIIITSKEQLGR